MKLAWKTISLFLLLAELISRKVVSECANACSGHGKCGSYDMCTCYRNWMGNDCSLRICQFGNAYVDSPKGDLDGSEGELSGPDETVVVNDFLYPYGTTELYPNMATVEGIVLENTAHEYRECSNSGYCDRKSGLCNCFAGYEGSSCQRMSCAAVNGKTCNGHGVCLTSQEIASRQYHSIYDLWDENIILGCICDAGYFGPSCERRKCKSGFDPLYLEQSSRRYSNWTLLFSSTGMIASIIGNYSIIFYDEYGQEWRTIPITYDAPCSSITLALEQLPNQVIPTNSVRCLKWSSFYSADSDEPSSILSSPIAGVKYILNFPENPGYLRHPYLDIYLDGSRPTLQVQNINASLNLYVFPEGYSGENFEYFTTLCVGVDFSFQEYQDSTTNQGYVYLTGLTPIEIRLLAQCLGDSDGNPDNFSAAGRVMGQNYTWDYGTIINPHLVRIVDLTENALTDICLGSVDSIRNQGPLCSYPDDESPPGFFAPLIYDSNDQLFKLLTNPSVYYSQETIFGVYSTSGVAQASSLSAKIITNPSKFASHTLYSMNSTSVHTNYDGDLACESTVVNINGILQCVEKGNTVFIIDPSLSLRSFKTNPTYMNLFTVEKIWTRPISANTQLLPDNEIILDKAAVSSWGPDDNAILYHFFLPDDEYQYVSPCSNRGVCNEDDGICDCFPGYTLDDCSLQAAASV